MPATGRDRTPDVGGRDAPSGHAAQRPKLHKALAALGLGSRRQMEQWISVGRVAVNGAPAHLGQRVGPQDRITVDGRPPKGREPDFCQVLVLNKPEGVICTRRDPQGRRTVFEGLPKLQRGRWMAVGRLDLQTSGLLVLANDGELVNRMAHPATGLDREYAVRVDGRLADAEAALLMQGALIEGERCAFTDLRYYDGSGRNHWYHVALMDGKNHAVRNLFAHVGHPVSRLKRVRYGPIALPSTLPRGRFAELCNSDLKRLYGLLKLPAALPKRGAATPSLLLPYPDLPSLA